MHQSQNENLNEEKMRPFKKIKTIIGILLKLFMPSKSDSNRINCKINKEEISRIEKSKAQTQQFN